MASLPLRFSLPSAWQTALPFRCVFPLTPQRMTVLSLNATDLLQLLAAARSAAR